MQLNLRNGDSIYLRNFIKIPNRLLISICEPTDREMVLYKIKSSMNIKLSRKSMRLLLLLFMLKEDFKESTDIYENDLGSSALLNARTIAEILNCEKREVLRALEELQTANIINYYKHYRGENLYMVEVATDWLKGSTTNYTELDSESLRDVLNLKNSTCERFGKNEIKLYLRFMMDNSQNRTTMNVHDVKNRVSNHLNYKTKISKFTKKLESLFNVRFDKRELSYKRKGSVRKLKDSYKAMARKRISDFIKDITNKPTTTTESKSYKELVDIAIARLTNVSLITGIHNIIVAIKLTFQEYHDKREPLEMLEQLPGLAATISYSLLNNNMNL